MSASNTPPGGSNDGWGAPPQSGTAPPTGWQQPMAGGPGAGAPPAGGWSPPQGGPPPSGGAWTPPPNPGKPSGAGCGKVVGIIVAIFALGIGGLVALGVALSDGGKAEIVGFEVAEDSPGYNAHVEATLVFLETPESEDLSNVVVRITSIALNRDLEFDWAYIAEHDDRPETVPGSPPPLGTELNIRFDIDSELKATVTYDYSISMTIQLDWAGKKRDKQTEDIMHIYPSPA